MSAASLGYTVPFTSVRVHAGKYGTEDIKKRLQKLNTTQK